MSVGEGFEDLDFALEIVEQLRAEFIALDRFQGYLPPRFLGTPISQGWPTEQHNYAPRGTPCTRWRSCLCQSLTRQCTALHRARPEAAWQVLLH